MDTDPDKAILDCVGSLNQVREQSAPESNGSSVPSPVVVPDDEEHYIAMVEGSQTDGNHTVAREDLLKYVAPMLSYGDKPQQEVEAMFDQINAADSMAIEFHEYATFVETLTVKRGWKTSTKHTLMKAYQKAKAEADFKKAQGELSELNATWKTRLCEAKSRWACEAQSAGLRMVLFSLRRRDSEAAFTAITTWQVATVQGRGTSPIPIVSPRTPKHPKLGKDMKGAIKTMLSDGELDAGQVCRLLTQLFEDADVDGSRSLDKEELAEVLRAYYKTEGVLRKLETVQKEVDNAMTMYDKDNSGRLELKEFVSMFAGMAISGEFRSTIPRSVLQEVAGMASPGPAGV